MRSAASGLATGQLIKRRPLVALNQNVTFKLLKPSGPGVKGGVMVKVRAQACVLGQQGAHGGIEDASERHLAT